MFTLIIAIGKQILLQPTPSIGENKCDVECNTDADESGREIVDDRMRVDASDSNDDSDGYGEFAIFANFVSQKL